MLDRSQHSLMYRVRPLICLVLLAAFLSPVQVASQDLPLDDGAQVQPRQDQSPPSGSESRQEGPAIDPNEGADPEGEAQSRDPEASQDSQETASSLETSLESQDESSEPEAPPAPPPTPAQELDRTRFLNQDYYPFAKNRFTSEGEAHSFIRLIEGDKAAADQFILDLTQEQVSNRYLVTIQYQESATEEGPYILFYASTELETEAEAVDFAEDTLLLFPDIFFDFDIQAINNQLFDVIFAIRTQANTQAIVMNNRTNEISYRDQRQPFTYELEADAQGRYEDPIQETIQAKRPQSFIFERQELTDGTIRVTMIPRGQAGSGGHSQVSILSESLDHPQVELLEEESQATISGTPLAGRGIIGRGDSAIIILIGVFVVSVTIIIMMLVSVMRR